MADEIRSGKLKLQPNSGSHKDRTTEVVRNVTISSNGEAAKIPPKKLQTAKPQERVKYSSGCTR